MVKDQITVTIERDLRKKVDEIVEKQRTWGSNRSAVIEHYIRIGLKKEERDASVEK